MKPDDKKKNHMLGHYFSSHPEAMERINNLLRVASEMNLVAKDVLPLPAVLDTQD